jgi:hypothetical protein
MPDRCSHRSTSFVDCPLPTAARAQTAIEGATAGPVEQASRLRALSLGRRVARVLSADRAGFGTEGRQEANDSGPCLTGSRYGNTATVLAAVVIAVTVVVVVALVIWMWATGRVPERAASHGQPDSPRRRETDEVAAGVDRPADPNAEAQYPVTGDAAPGPPSGAA